MIRIVLALAMVLALFGCDHSSSGNGETDGQKLPGKADGPFDSPFTETGAIHWEVAKATRTISSHLNIGNRPMMATLSRKRERNSRQWLKTRN